MNLKIISLAFLACTLSIVTIRAQETFNFHNRTGLGKLSFTVQGGDCSANSFAIGTNQSYPLTCKTTPIVEANGYKGNDFVAQGIIVINPTSSKNIYVYLKCTKDWSYCGLALLQE